jgi:hypothetical protein
MRTLSHRIKGICSFGERWCFGAKGSRFSRNLLKKLTTLHSANDQSGLVVSVMSKGIFSVRFEQFRLRDAISRFCKGGVHRVRPDILRILL